MNARSGHSPALAEGMRRFAAALDRRGIAWVVLRNDEHFPLPRGRFGDIDLLIDANRRREALELLRPSFEAEGCKLCLAYANLEEGLDCVYLGCPGSPALHLDLFWRISYRGQVLFPAGRILDEREPTGNDHQVPRYGHRAAIACVNHCLHHGVVKQEYRPMIVDAARRDRDGMLAFFAYRLNRFEALRLLDAILAEDWESVARGVRRMGQTGWLGRAADGLHAAYNAAQRLIHRSPGLFVAFMGPDGSGKSTLLNAYAQRMASLYLPEKQRTMHWRPRLLPAPGAWLPGQGGEKESADAEHPHGRLPHTPLLSLLRLAYFALDYALGAWLKVYPGIARGRLLMADRWVDDLWIDRCRYRLRLPVALIRSVGALAADPDLIFVLVAPAAVLHGRKQELPLGELDRQLGDLRGLPARHPGARIVRVDRPVSEIVDELEQLTIDFLAERTAVQRAEAAA